MSQGWSKLFSRINWINRPSKATSLGATNLNKSDYALDEIDNRVIQLDTLKADMNVVNGMVSDVSLDESNGVITITYKDGSTKTYDTNLEKIAVNFGYDSETERLILTMPDGTTQYVDLSALITQFEFVNSNTIAFSVDASGKVSASIKNGSITEAMLETGYLADIKVEVAKAEAAVTQAQSSEASSDYNAKLSRSYAIGGSGIRDGEDTDNAMYYNAQAQEALSKMQDAQVTGVKGAKETTYRKGEVNITAENVGAVAVDGDTAENTVTFTSTDAKNPTAYTDVDVLATGETHKSIFAKISTMFKNIRYLYKMLGNTDISSIGDGTATGAISTLNSNISVIKLLWSGDASKTNDVITLSEEKTNYDFLLVRTYLNADANLAGAVENAVIIPSYRGLNSLSQFILRSYKNNSTITHYDCVMYYKFTSQKEILITDAFRVLNESTKEDYQQIHVYDIYGVKCSK